MSQTKILPPTPPLTPRGMTKSASPSPPLRRSSSSSGSSTSTTQEVPSPPSSLSLPKTTTTTTTTTSSRTLPLKKRKVSPELSSTMKKELDDRSQRFRRVLNKKFLHPNAEQTWSKLMQALAQNEGDLHLRLSKILNRDLTDTTTTGEQSTWGTDLKNPTHSPSAYYTSATNSNVVVFHLRGQCKINRKPQTYMITIACCLLTEEVQARFVGGARSNIAFGHTIYYSGNDTVWNRDAHAHTAEMRLWRKPALALPMDTARLSVGTETPTPTTTINAKQLDAPILQHVRRYVRQYGSESEKIDNTLKESAFWGSLLTEPPSKGKYNTYNMP